MAYALQNSNTKSAYFSSEKLFGVSLHRRLGRFQQAWTTWITWNHLAWKAEVVLHGTTLAEANVLQVDELRFDGSAASTCSRFLTTVGSTAMSARTLSPRRWRRFLRAEYWRISPPYTALTPGQRVSASS